MTAWHSLLYKYNKSDEYVSFDTWHFSEDRIGEGQGEFTILKIPLTIAPNYNVVFLKLALHEVI